MVVMRGENMFESGSGSLGLSCVGCLVDVGVSVVGFHHGVAIHFSHLYVSPGDIHRLFLLFFYPFFTF